VAVCIFRTPSSAHAEPAPTGRKPRGPLVSRRPILFQGTYDAKRNRVSASTARARTDGRDLPRRNGCGARWPRLLKKFGASVDDECSQDNKKDNRGDERRLFVGAPRVGPRPTRRPLLTGTGNAARRRTAVGGAPWYYRDPFKRNRVCRCSNRAFESSARCW